jgi:hypothetical protein
MSAQVPSVSAKRAAEKAVYVSRMAEPTIRLDFVPRPTPTTPHAPKSIPILQTLVDGVDIPFESSQRQHPCGPTVHLPAVVFIHRLISTDGHISDVTNVRGDGDGEEQSEIVRGNVGGRTRNSSNQSSEHSPSTPILWRITAIRRESFLLSWREGLMGRRGLSSIIIPESAVLNLLHSSIIQEFKGLLPI